MSSRLLFAGTLLLLSSSLALAATEPPQVKSAQIEDDRLEIEFDQPMLTWRDVRDTAGVTLTPRSDCVWYWEDDTHLACQVQRLTARDRSFRPATAYRLQLPASLWSQAGVALAPTERTVVSSRPDVDVAVKAWQAGLPELQVTSRGMPVSAADLSRVLELRLGEARLDYTLEALSSEQRKAQWLDEPTVAFRVVPVGWPSTERTLSVALLEGLRSAAGPVRGAAKSLLVARINVPLRLVDMGCGWSRMPLSEKERSTAEHRGCGADSAISLVFTRRLAEGEPARIAAAVPGLTASEDTDYCRWACGSNEPRFSYSFKAEAAGRRMVVALPADLRAQDGSLIEALASPEIVFRDRPYDVTAEPRLQLVRPGAEAALSLKVRNLPEPATVAQLATGRRTRLRDATLPLAGITNAYQTWRAPPPPGDIDQRGGLALAGVRGDDNDGFAIAVAPFNVIAAADKKRVLVWASDWDSAAAVADARLELIDVTAAGRETVLARGRTGADGVGYLPTPQEDLEDDDTQARLVRVSHGGRQTVIPVLTYWGELPVAGIPARDWDGIYYNDRDEARHFGVSDRLLYRPGESVNFRLWSRQRERNRMRLLDGKPGETVELVLRKQGASSVMDAWTASRDAWGSVAGEHPLAGNLADGSYCITRKDDRTRYYSPSGACFDVARFDSAAVWASNAFDRKVVRAGGELALDIEGGFYSGGGAAGAAVSAMAHIAPTPFGSLYPEFARFTFISPLDSNGESSDADPLSTLSSVTHLDGRGKARFSGRLPSRFLHGGEGDVALAERDMVAIGEIRVTAAVSIPGAASSSSPVASVVYAAFDRYVGLRNDGWWLPSDEDPRLEATVATAGGDAVPGVNVSVRIERTDDKGAGEVLARCELTVGVEAPCAFRAPKAGEYRFVAEFEDAAPAEFTRYFYSRESRPDKADAPKVELSLVTPPQAGQDAVLRLLQPHPRASALFVVEYGTVLKHWVQEVGPDSQVRLPVPAEWAPAVSVRVLLRPAGDAPSTTALDPTTLSASVRVPVVRADAGKVSVTLAPGARAPGEDLVLTLANATATPRLVTLAIVDDSVHQQAASLHGLTDPNGRRFLGLLESWSGAQWYGFGDWRVPNLFQEARVRIVGEPMPAPAPPSEAAAPVTVMGESYETLDLIEVVGSRIKRADLVESGDDPATANTPPREAPSAQGPPAPRVRSRFPVTAYWNAGETLAPGETRELRLRLPDNLTRWRLVYWTSDDSDHFTVGEETFVATLPLEIRAGLPSRLFQGDQGSGTVLARVNAGQGADVSLEVTTDGAGADVQVKAEGRVAPQASLARLVPLVPDAQGRIALLARASTDTTSDALSSAVEVRSRLATVAIAQAGWLEGGPLALSRPDVPSGAISPVLSVRIAQGTAPWRDGWLRDLREYPHRCWEQTLSRGIGAALALQDAATAAAWPEAGEVVASTLRDAPSFLDDEGHYRYFAGGEDRYSRLDPVLSAYTLRGFQVLDALGHAVPMAWRTDLRSQLDRYAAEALKNDASSYELERRAIAAGALATDGKNVADAVVPSLWRRRDEMSWFGRSELVRAAAANPRHADLAAQGLAELRDAGVQNGVRRVLKSTGDWSFLMGSPLRDQCAITATLFALDRSPEHLAVRQQWLRGLSDLYAGGTGSLDTQSSVQCLLALRAAGAALDTSGSARVAVSNGQQTTELVLAPGELSSQWEAPLAPTAELALTPMGGSDGTLNYSAQVSYVLDQRNAVAQATGMQLQRRYQVMRGGEWRGLGDGSVAEGEWLRTTLTVVVPAMRHFVAITDTVPGGLVTRDVRLGGVAGEDVKRLADEGSWWFDTRQTGANEVRFYAQQLPPGTHELHYYTQATHAGRYFAPPAVAELMYGRNSRANTVSNDLRVTPRP